MMTVLRALEGARTDGEYNAAKRLATGLTVPEQFAIVNAAIAARARVRGAE